MGTGVLSSGICSYPYNQVSPQVVPRTSNPNQIAPTIAAASELHAHPATYRHEIVESQGRSGLTHSLGRSSSSSSPQTATAPAAEALALGLLLIRAHSLT